MLFPMFVYVTEVRIISGFYMIGTSVMKVNDDISDCLQMSRLRLSGFKQINELLFALKSVENHSFFDDLKKSRSQIRSSSLNIPRKIWKWL